MIKSLHEAWERFKFLFNGVALVEGVDNEDFFRAFHDFVSKYLQDTTLKKHLDIGFGKDDLKIAKYLAHETREKGGKVVYYDSTNRIEADKQSLPDNLSISQEPDSDFDTTTLIFPHDKALKGQAKETLVMARGYLKPGGLVVIIDYDLRKRVLKSQNPREALREIFDKKNEQSAIEREPYWFEAHTYYDLQCWQQDCRSVGLKTIGKIATRPRKLFMGIFQKSLEQQVSEPENPASASQ